MHSIGGALALMAAVARATSDVRPIDLSQLGFPAAVAQRRDALPSCGAPFRGAHSHASNAVFEDTIGQLQRRFQQVFAQNLRTFVTRSQQIYKRSDDFAKRAVSEANYAQIFKLRKAMMALARRRALEREAQRLAGDPSCFNAQLAQLHRSSCAAAHAEAPGWTAHGRQRFFAIRPDEAASMAGSCARNMELSCKLAPLMHLVDPENRVAAQRVRNCAALRRWRRCVRGDGECTPQLSVVTRRFFSPAGLRVTNGYGRSVWIGATPPAVPFQYRLSPAGPQL